jgi:hypothetical protein
MALGLIIARIYLRIVIQRRRILLGDYMMIVGWLSALAVIGLAIILMQDDALQPDVSNTLEGFESSPAQIQEIYKIFWIFNLPLFSTFYLCKGALLSMYLEIFPRFMVKRRLFLWATIIFIGTAYAASILALFLLCTPIETYWDLRPESTCPPVKTKIIFIIAWALHFAGDLLVFILPWTIVGGINCRRTLKYGIYCTLLLGLITMTFSLLRFILVIRSQVGDVGPISLAVLWSILECNLGLNITCLPSLRPYFTRGGEPSPRNSGRGHSGPKVTDTIRTIGRIRSKKQRNLSLGPRESLGVTLGGTMAGTLAGTEEELTWNEGKQSHRSQSSDADMELVQSKPVVVEDIA